RNVSLDMWIDAVRENLQQAREAGLITAAVEKKVSAGLPTWFAALRERGYKENDRLLYRVRADSLRTVVVSADGKILVDKLDKDKVAPRVVMASYFAPKSDFREPLLRSFFTRAARPSSWAAPTPRSPERAGGRASRARPSPLLRSLFERRARRSRAEGEPPSGDLPREGASGACSRRAARVDQRRR